DYALNLARVPAQERNVLREISSYSFRLRAGDDASCLNLAQPLRPRLLGASRSFLEKRGGFAFQRSEAQTAEEIANPGLLLEKPQSDGAVPVIADGTTAEWQLKRKLGQELTVPGDGDEPIRLRLVGLLQDSIFQSELLMSEANFRRLFAHEG